MEKLRSQLAEAATKAKEEAAYVFSEELAKAKELKAASAKLKEAASLSIDSAKQRVASNVGLNESAGASLGALLPSKAASYLLGSARGGGDAGRDDGGDDTDADDEADDEKGRLVDGGGSSSAEDKLRTGLAAASAGFGSALRATGVMSMTGLSQPRQAQPREGVPAARLAGGASSAAELTRAADAPLSEAPLSAAWQQTLDGARSQVPSGYVPSGVRQGVRQGVERLRAAKEHAKEATQERCGDVLSAASAVSGVSLRPKEEEPRLDRLCRCCPALSYKQRLAGMACCMLAGLLLSLSSLLSFTQLMLGNPLPFAFKYTVGNLLALGSTAFLVGPTRQARDMLAPSRRVASLVYGASLVSTLLSTLVLRRASLSLLFILLQMLALTWYTLSYVPYGQAAAKSLLRRVLKRAGVVLPAGAMASTARVAPAGLSALTAAGEGS